MRGLLTSLLVLCLFCLAFASIDYDDEQNLDYENSAYQSETDSIYRAFYKELGLNDKVSFEAFEQAMAGYEIIDKKKPILTLIDFSKPSTEERLYVINVEKKKILYKSVVSHGKNSGGNFVSSFSNKPGSCQSSLGFFLTEQTYKGRNGLSLVIDGLEKGINDNAKRRAVVIHGADYANPRKAKAAGRLGRSQGCPALPREMTQPIINTIKGGSVIYAYCDKFNDEYLEKSAILAEYSNKDNDTANSDLLSLHIHRPAPY